MKADPWRLVRNGEKSVHMDPRSIERTPIALKHAHRPYCWRLPLGLNFPEGHNIIAREGRRTRSLNIQPFRRALILPIQNFLPRRCKVRFGDPHSPLSEREKTCLGTDSFDIGPTQIVLGHNELLQINVFREAHTRGMESEDMALGLYIWQGELDLAVDTAWSDECWVERVDSVCRHDYFDIPAGVETVELIEKF